MFNALNDKEFLKKLDNTKEKQTYIRLTSLDNNNNYLETLEGRATGGSINIDGASALRRSCSLSLVAFEDEEFEEGEVPITDAYWGLKNRFILEVGIKNTINPNYPDIIWFKQGHFLVNNFSFNININGGININISGQDKMAMLNGTIGGQFLSEIDFGTEEEISEWGNVQIHKVPIYTIVKNIIQIYAQEPIENIIINDLEEEHAWELWEYRGKDPMYMIGKKQNDTFKIFNIILDGNTVIDGHLISSDEIIYYNLNSLKPQSDDEPTKIKFNEEENCVIVKVEYGETAGYHAIELVYPSDLIAKAGETITSVLDKIIKVLPNFEYFYDINGRFVFQKKKDYIQELYSPVTGEIVNATMVVSPYEYKFEDMELFTAVSVAPNINNIKNDFVVWGSKDSTTGSLPFHARCAIHEKPTSYNSLNYYEKIKLTYINVSPYTSGEPFICVLEENGKKHFKIEHNDVFDETKLYDITFPQSKDYKYELPFEIIENKYQIELGFNEDYNLILEDFESINLYGQTSLSYAPELIASFIPEKNDEGIYEFTKQICYYNFDYQLLQIEAIPKENKNVSSSSFNSFILKLYPLLQKFSVKESASEDFDGKIYKLKNEQYIETDDELPGETTIEHPALTYDISEHPWQELIYQMAVDYYRHNMEPEFLINLEKDNTWCKNGKTGYEQFYQDIYAFWRLLYDPDKAGKNYGSLQYEYDDSGWNKYIYSDPSKLPYWLEFLDLGGAELAKYSIPNIGHRPKVVNDSMIKTIYYKEIPEAQFIIAGEEEIVSGDSTSYQPLQIQKSTEDLFARSSQGTSAIEKINTLLNQYCCHAEGLTLTSIPIWHLKPNTRIYVEDYGDYILDKISYSINYNSTMNLTCTKVIKQIF